MKAGDLKVDGLYKDDCTGKFRLVKDMLLSYKPGSTWVVQYQEFFPGTPYVTPVLGSCTQEAFAQWASREATPEELESLKDQLPQQAGPG